ncbi:MAG TPA: UDP-N-acetylmuramoyl-tripeptide--D-alanyl-D-alanine ligase [Saprospiraceae bacterium]
MKLDIPSLYSIFLKHPVISTDTRKITPGCIFFALKGSNFDGNTFAAQALTEGASYAVVDDPSIEGPRFIYVKDTLLALQSLANYHRRQFNIPVLAITGSNGKTTTKELVSAVLSKAFNVHATRGNLNNHIGVPLTLLGITQDTEFVVCEMGANHPGEIASLCDIAEPTSGLITNIGKAHLEGFGSLEGVKKAKGELYAYLSQHNGLGFVNTDDLNLRDLATTLGKKKTYGFNPDGKPELYFSYSTKPGERGFIIHDQEDKVSIKSSMFGHYNATNVLAAYTVGNHFNVRDEQIALAIEQYVPGSNRSEIITHRDCIFVKDAYNANPSSMELALTAFSSQYPHGWVVLGDMKELGEDSAEAHRQIIMQVSKTEFERVFLVGHTFAKSLDDLQLKDPRFSSVANIKELSSNWIWEQCKNKAILLKGSRSMQLEMLLETGND